MIANDPRYQQAIDQKMAQYTAQTQQAMQGLTYQQPPQNPASYGFGQMANALTRPAGPPNNPSTGLFQAVNPYNFMVMNYLLQQSQPGMGGSTLAPSTQDAQSPELIAQLLRQTGV